LKEWETASGKITVACDNISALRHCMDLEVYPKISGNMPDFDIIQAVCRSLHPNILYKWKHVKGHQDQVNNSYDWWARLNILADTKATERQNNLSQNYESPVWNAILPHEKLQIILDPNKVCKPIQCEIVDFISANTMKVFWHKHKRILDSNFANVDWVAVSRASKMLTKSCHQWMVKQATGICAVNSVLVERGAKSSPECPRCGEFETKHYVFQCQQAEASLVWEQSIFMHENPRMDFVDTNMVSELNFVYNRLYRNCCCWVR
jgi:hypothetical protein